MKARRSYKKNFSKIGCTVSKLDVKLCQHDETAQMHSDFIKANGQDIYNKVMGIKTENANPRIDDHSKTLNLSLVNVESKTKLDTINKYLGFNWKECVKLALANPDFALCCKSPLQVHQEEENQVHQEEDFQPQSNC